MQMYSGGMSRVNKSFLLGSKEDADTLERQLDCIVAYRKLEEGRRQYSNSQWLRDSIAEDYDALPKKWRRA